MGGNQAQPAPKRQRTGPVEDLVVSDSNTLLQDETVKVTKESFFTHDGDLRLVIGSGENVILVHSSLLVHYCPELKRQLTKPPNQAEIGCEEQPKLELSEDSITAWVMFCHIIYGRAMGKRIPASSILELALMANKYGSVEKLFYGLKFCFQRVSCLDVSCQWKILIATWLLRDSRQFQRYSNILTAKPGPSFLRLAESCPVAGLGLKLCCMKGSFFFSYAKFPAG
ncbi:hypothetical protein E4U21_005672 [Claviceps maximensis]|nr:hypothetical protein E4U21_005672 [Claviceps maximensis]